MKRPTKSLFYIKRLAIALFVLWVIVYGLPDLFSYIGSQKKNALYINVKAPNTWSSYTQLVKDFVNEEPPLYLIESDNLYLLIQTVWNAALFMEGSHEEWDSKRIQALMKQKELRKYFPDPDAPDGGIAWIPFPPKPKKNSVSP